MFIPRRRPASGGLRTNANTFSQVWSSGMDELWFLFGFESSEIDMSSRATKQLTRLRSPSAKEAIDCMRRDGAVIFKQLVPVVSIKQALADVQHALEHGYGKYKEGDFFEDRTSRATGLLRLSSSYAHDQLGHRLLRDIADHFLTTRHEERMANGEPYLWETPPQISSCIAFKIDPGAKAQILHRDDSIYHNVHEPITTWTEPRDLSRDSSLSLFVAGTESTADNGATRLIPGSHLLGSNEEPQEKDAIPAELEPGDGLFMLSSVYHGGGANITSERTRIVFASSIIRGILRQEENQFLTVPMETMRKYPENVQRFAGFLQQFPELGWVNSMQDQA
ncbi:hypothetical protein M409DRAFT_19075 [Zasmidium cellare ATCC 36951]|uniref:Uncharacterized protein n=1 Tax=Zasmidium cellare ATCC 36951 TaxID=1080233 RepID=A0A6A6CVD6_ZASCE|nr:uncharacterized protein M409DRAFT_19075 [Zasmidium cellare ATCC 36951]KAF2171104.1 hypothetical protein M409DRAFT_19075 [Zasmidium cellare ATCC 36951]